MQQAGADRQPPFQHQFLISAHGLVVGDDVVDGGDAAAERALGREYDPFLHLLVAVGRDDVAHQELRALDQLAGKLAGRRIDLDRAAAGRRAVPW